MTEKKQETTNIEFKEQEHCTVPRWIQYKAQLDNLNYNDFFSAAHKNDNAVLLDVRTAEEFAQGTIGDAINFNYLSPTLADEIEGLNKEMDYYIFCRTGRRSLRVCMLLKNSGYKVYNLEEGISKFI